MGQQSKEKEPCKKEACEIQACLTKNNFLPQKCLRVIELLESCCEKCHYNSTHCASLSGLLGKNHQPKLKPKPNAIRDSYGRINVSIN